MALALLVATSIALKARFPSSAGPRRGSWRVFRPEVKKNSINFKIDIKSGISFDYGPLRLLRRVRDFAEADGGTITKDAAASALKRLEIDSDGLDALDRRYLHALVKTYAGGPVGVETLAAALSEARDAVEDVIEPYLMQKGYVARTPRGRVAAPLAYDRLGLPNPGTGQAGLFGEK